MPVDCEPGRPVIISRSFPDEKANRRFSQDWKDLRPYLHMMQLRY